MKPNLSTRFLAIGSLLSISFLLPITAQTGSDAIQDNLTINPRTYTGFADECAVQTLSTTGAVSVSNGANVIFEAGRQIHLTPGFHAAEGSKFHAQIGLSVANLNRPSATDGAPVGLLAVVDSNTNGIPDLIEYNLGLDPRADNSNDSRIQALQAQAGTPQQQPYQYDKNSQLTDSPDRTYQLDEEGNITGKKQP